MSYAVAVLDIGKTNKKLLVYDERLTVVHATSTRIETVTVEGLDVEDIDAIESWALDQLTIAARSWPIRAISVSGHGATVVCVGADGRPSVPPVAYTNEVDEAFHDAFAAEIGAPDDLQVPTATAEVRPLINVAKLLYFEKRRWPDAFARTRHILLYPQYFAWRLSGAAAAEATYLGSHTYLLDPRTLDWSPVVDRLGIRAMLPERVGRPTDVIGTITADVAQRTGLNRDTKVLAGIHDSNASILPYLITRDDEFVLNSTGTWCVAMHPAREVAFAADEIGRMVFYNVSYVGQPIKTSILMGGLEYDTYRSLIASRHPEWTPAPFDATRYLRIAREMSLFVLPSVVVGAGQFPGSHARIIEDGTRYPLPAIQDGTSVPAVFATPDDAIAAVNLSIAIQSAVALRRTGLATGTPIYVEGGFRNNDAYLAILAALLPDNPISLTTLEEATSTGAALTAIAAAEGVSVDTLGERVTIHEEPVSPPVLPGVETYAARLLELVAE